MTTDFPPYRPPVWLRSGHAQTLYASLVRRVPGVAYRRERLDLEDGDFLDLDWLGGARGRNVAVVAHGLEGSTDRSYVRGMAKELHRRGWAVCAWNLRGCSGEPNRLLRAYHSGATDDLEAVVQHVLRRGAEAVAVLGFSLGGNLTVRWLGEHGAGLDGRVVAGAGVSVPVDLASSAETMRAWSRRIYMRYFLRKLAVKVEEKAGRFPDAPDPAGVGRMTSFAEFDGAFTAPVHGFESAQDYWERASSKPLLPSVAVPTLLVNARDDPFLSASCFPRAEARANPNLTLLAPREGGHVGFVTPSGPYWSEAVVGRHLDAALSGARGTRGEARGASSSRPVAPRT